MSDEKKQISLDDAATQFELFLKENGYEIITPVPEDVNNSNVVDNPNIKFKLPRIRKISEDLNNRPCVFDMYEDTTQLSAGLVVYTIEKIEPDDKIPYVTYKPAPRIITEIQDNGVNKGTVFFTYAHKVVQSPEYYKSEKTKKCDKVVSEPEIIYSPLTKSHAEYICKLLNLQSKQTYQKHIKQMQSKRVNGR